MTSRTHFVYSPQSGPNWLGEAEPRDADSAHEIPMATPAVVWPNGCAHVYGVGLSWEPGTRAGRAELGKLLEALAVAAGGVAWDERGRLCVVVPSYLARDIARAVDSVEPLALGDMACIPEQREYEIAGPEYWAERIRAWNCSGSRDGAWLSDPDGWSTTCETYDRAGDVLADGTETPAIRYTRLTWHRPGGDPVEVGAPWEPAEMYPRPRPRQCDGCMHATGDGCEIYGTVPTGWVDDDSGQRVGAGHQGPCPEHKPAPGDESPQLPDHVLKSKRYQGSGEVA